MLAVIASLLLQDQQTLDAFQDFCKKPKFETMDNAKACIRRNLDQIFKDSSLWYALYLVTCYAGEKGTAVPGDVLRKLGEHVAKIAAEKPDVAKHLEYAEALAGEKSEFLQLVAMGHLDDAIKGKGDAGKVEAIAKKLGLEMNEGAWAAPLFLTLARMKTLAQADPGRVGTHADFVKNDAFPVRYYRAICMLKAIAKNQGLYKDCEKLLGQLKSDPYAREHCDALKKQLDIYFDCATCQKKRESTCGGCGGKGERELVCHWCKGTGVGETKVVNGVTTTIGCPTCLNKNPKRVEKCNFCAGKGKVPCERCKYMLPKYEDLAKDVDCPRCEKTGTSFTHIKAPCPFCVGLGFIVKPAAAPDKRAGVPE